MSIQVPIAELTHHQQEMIFKFLRIKPKPSLFLQRKFGKGFRGKKDDEVRFYIFDEITGMVTLPFSFYNILSIKSINCNNKYPTVDTNFTGSLLEDQIPIVAEALEHLKSKSTTIIGIPPGSGKTVIGAHLSCDTQMMTAVLVPRKTLLVQWKKTFELFTTHKVWIVGATPFPTHDLPTVIICMAARVMSLPEEYRNLFGLLIIDEAHMFCVKSCVNPLLGWKPRYIVAETATLARADEMHCMIHAICGTHGIFISSKKPFFVYKVLTNIVPYAEDPSNWGQIKSSLFNSPQRNYIICDLVRRNLHHKILILTHHIDHAEKLAALIDQMGITVDHMAGTKKMYENSQVLVGTISLIGTGFDEATFCPTYDGRPIDLLILASSIKSLPQVEQAVGRIRSKIPHIIDLVDSNNICYRHFIERKKWYRTRNGKVFIIDISLPPKSLKFPEGFDLDIPFYGVKETEEIMEAQEDLIVEEKIEIEKQAEQIDFDGKVEINSIQMPTSVASFQKIPENSPIGLQIPPQLIRLEEIALNLREKNNLTAVAETNSSFLAMDTFSPVPNPAFLAPNPIPFAQQQNFQNNPHLLQNQNYFHPDSNYFQPDPNYFQPDPNYFQPGPNYFQSDPNYFQPDPNYFQPNPNYFQPNPNYFQSDPNYAPSSAGYAPSSAGYAPSSTGYTPSSAGYTPSSTGYAPSSAGYTPSSAGYIFFSNR